MSEGDPDANQSEKTCSDNEDDDVVDSVPESRPERPLTSRPGTRRNFSNYSQASASGSGSTVSMQQYQDENPPGAVGGEGFVGKVSEQEERVAEQARLLLERFIMDRAAMEHVEQTSVLRQNICHQDKRREQQPNLDYLDDVSIALRQIGDQLSQDYELNRLIDMVPIQSPRDIFIKVCKQMFQDNQFNWGRVVALFYFAYKLIVKALSQSMDSIPWIKEILSWAIDYLMTNVAWWIIQRGGWNMIQEYWGSPSRALGGLLAACLATIVFVYWKQK